jgi:hypothetical protein
MSKKSISFVVVSFSLCTLAIATEYKSPDVAFKTAKPSTEVLKTAELNDNYKVEGAAYTDRQIASENEPSDREPSSITTKMKPKVEPVEDMPTEEKMGPKPWLYRNKSDVNK